MSNKLSLVTLKHLNLTTETVDEEHLTLVPFSYDSVKRLKLKTYL